MALSRIWAAFIITAMLVASYKWIFNNDENIFEYISNDKNMQFKDATVEEIPLQEEALDNLSAAEIFNLIVQLPVGYRTVFNLYAIEGFPHGEIASLLGIAEGTSKSQLSKAKILLQKLLLQNDIEYAKRNFLS